MTRKNLLGAVAIILVMLALYGVMGFVTAFRAESAGPFVMPAITAATSSIAQVGPQENIQIVASSSRSYLYIARDDGVSDVYCKADGDNLAVVNEGIKLSTSTSNIYEFFLEKNPYDGAVRCTASASTTLVVTEFKRN